MPQGDVALLGGAAPIAVAATASPGTTLYTMVSGTEQTDSVRLVASNLDASVSVDLTIEYGGVATLNQLWFQLRPKSTLELPLLRGNGGLVIKAFASLTNKINVYVDVDRYTN